MTNIAEAEARIAELERTYRPQFSRPEVGIAVISTLVTFPTLIDQKPWLKTLSVKEAGLRQSLLEYLASRFRDSLQVSPQRFVVRQEVEEALEWSFSPGTDPKKLGYRPVTRQRFWEGAAGTDFVEETFLDPETGKERMQLVIKTPAPHNPVKHILTVEDNYKIVACPEFNPYVQIRYEQGWLEKINYLPRDEKYWKALTWEAQSSATSVFHNKMRFLQRKYGEDWRNVDRTAYSPYEFESLKKVGLAPTGHDFVPDFRIADAYVEALVGRQEVPDEIIQTAKIAAGWAITSTHGEFGPNYQTILNAGKYRAQNPFALLMDFHHAGFFGIGFHNVGEPLTQNNYLGQPFTVREAGLTAHFRLGSNAVGCWLDSKPDEVAWMHKKGQACSMETSRPISPISRLLLKRRIYPPQNQQTLD